MTRSTSTLVNVTATIAMQLDIPGATTKKGNLTRRQRELLEGEIEGALGRMFTFGPIDEGAVWHAEVVLLDGKEDSMR